MYSPLTKSSTMNYIATVLTLLGSSVCTGWAVTVGAVLVAIWVIKLVLFAVVFAALATLAQFDDLHMLNGGVVAVFATEFATGATRLRLGRTGSVLLALAADSVTLASLDPLNVFHPRPSTYENRRACSSSSAPPRIRPKSISIVYRAREIYN